MDVIIETHVLTFSRAQKGRRPTEWDQEELENVPLAKRAKSSPKPVPLAKRNSFQKPTKASASASPSSVAAPKPNEANSIGGLALGKAGTKGNKNTVMDLTKEDRGSADSKEVNFSKLQGKTYPSLVVVVRPSIRVREAAASNNDRSVLDSRVKSILMYTPTKFTEWLIQQGLIRSEQRCHVHPNQPLKLGMYSDVSKFACSGGYVWISECCANRFVSVFNGSLFEGAWQPPSVLLKLIYHWACQTNVQNVVQWVKVDNLYVKGFYSWLRSVCTVALYNHLSLWGGPGKKIEVGVISLGTSTMDGAQRQVKVEVLGVYDPVNKYIRLRAVEPLLYTEKVYKKRFLKILEPLVDWVHEDSIILTDMTVDKATLQNYGFRHVVQATGTADSSRAGANNSNATIMDYLRRVVPRMFQNTLSLLSRPIIQQFLDELVWREWYGSTPFQAFDNIIGHIAEQTRVNTKESLVSRLSKVAANPFKDWSHLSTKAPVAAATPAAAIPEIQATALTKSTAVTYKSAAAAAATQKRRRALSPVEKAAPAPKRAANAAKQTANAAKQTVSKAVQRKIEEPIDLISMEAHYYGVYNPPADEPPLDSCEEVAFEVKCPECVRTFVTNLELQDHVFEHAVKAQHKYQCRYCLEKFAENELLTKHIMTAHPIEVQPPSSGSSTYYYDLLCEAKFASLGALSIHMGKHLATELPFKCGACSYLASSRRLVIDHFYEEHARTAILQCPHCLQIFLCANRDEGALTDNVLAFVQHVHIHLQKHRTKKCNRCSMSFTQKGVLKQHQIFAHGSRYMLRNDLQPIGKGNTQIPRPRTRASMGTQLTTHCRIIEPLNEMRLDVPNGRLCLECGQDFDQDGHIIGLMQCQKCSYQTCCLPACLEHNVSCPAGGQHETFAVARMVAEYYCVCGYSGVDGNAMARHMLSCDRKSVYASVEQAQENTKQRNMLDMLGLVRRDDEEGSGGGLDVDSGQDAVVDDDVDNEGQAKADEESTPAADDVQEMEDVVEEQDVEEVEEEQAEANNETQGELIPDPNDADHDNFPPEEYAEAQHAADEAVPPPAEQFNMTLDDLAPQSVGMPRHMDAQLKSEQQEQQHLEKQLEQQQPHIAAEHDRTPQLREEYQVGFSFNMLFFGWG